MGRRYSGLTGVEGHGWLLHHTHALAFQNRIEDQVDGDSLLDDLRFAQRVEVLRSGSHRNIAQAHDTDDTELQSERLLDLARSWVAVELIDRSGNPLAGVYYEIRASGGELFTGTTDEQGRVTLDDIKLGPCRVCFPDLEGQQGQQ